MLRALIVDDEPLSRDELGYLLRRSKYVEIVGEADHLEQALQQIQLLKPDVVFLDIQLPEESGLDLARRLMELTHRPEIVFATAYDDYALNAFELNAVDYILKPFDEGRVQRMVEKLLRLQELRESRPSIPFRLKSKVGDRTERLAINVEDRILLIPVEDIVYIGFREGKTEVVTKDQHYKLSEPLATLERKLQNTPIIRVHRAFLVNLNGIVEIEPWFHSTYNLVMKDGSKVPVSRTYLKELKQLLGL
jgi:two-component system response regulator LytT